MSKTAQDIFQQILIIQKQQRDIRAMVRDGLAQSPEFQQIKTEFESLRQKKKTAEAQVNNQFERELSKLDDLKIDLETEREELCDVVLSRLMKGEIVKVHDQYNASYDVAVKVSFKKSDEQES